VSPISLRSIRRTQFVAIAAPIIVSALAAALVAAALVVATPLPAGAQSGDDPEAFTAVGGARNESGDRSIAGTGPLVVPAGADSVLVAALHYLEVGSRVKLRAHDGREIEGSLIAVGSAHAVLQIDSGIWRWLLTDIAEGWKRGHSIGKGFGTGAAIGGVLGVGLGLAIGIAVYRDGWFRSSGKGEISSIITPAVFFGGASALTFGMFGGTLGAMTPGWVPLDRLPKGAGDTIPATGVADVVPPPTDHPPVILEFSGGLAYANWRGFNLDGFTARGRFEMVRLGTFGLGAEVGYAWIAREAVLHHEGEPNWTQSVVALDDAMWGNIYGIKRWRSGVWQPHVVAGIGLAVWEYGYIDGLLGAGLDLRTGPGALNFEAVWYPRLFDHPDDQIESVATLTLGYRFRY